ncbi:MAG: SEL1-like repeat protein [Elusimicrobiaceae bacterium]|nr:SEL1-like repeat protein [Elusimicrobiaceae bacterium]
MRDFLILVAALSPLAGAFVRIKHPILGWVLIATMPCLLLLIILFDKWKESKNLTPKDPTDEEYYAVADDFLSYKEGTEKIYFSKHPEKARKVFQSSLRLLELMEQRNEVPMLEELYWVGMMYEEGFGGTPDLKKAGSYYEAALQADTCFRGDLEKRREEVLRRLSNLKRTN